MKIRKPTDHRDTQLALGVKLDRHLFWRHVPSIEFGGDTHLVPGQLQLRIARARFIRWVVYHVWAPMRWPFTTRRPAVDSLMVQWRWLIGRYPKTPKTSSLSLWVKLGDRVLFFGDHLRRANRECLCYRCRPDIIAYMAKNRYTTPRPRKEQWVIAGYAGLAAAVNLVIVAWVHRWPLSLINAVAAAAALTLAYQPIRQWRKHKWDSQTSPTSKSTLPNPPTSLSSSQQL